MRVFNKRVLIKPDPVKDQTEGGVILPDSAKEKPATGTVMDFDPELKLHKGDHVTYATYAAVELESFKGLVIVPFNDIWFSDTP